MAIALDGSVQGSTVSSGTTCTATLSTFFGNVIIIACVESNNNFTGAQAAISIADTAGLTWTKRAEIQVAANHDFLLSYFWAKSTLALSSDVITATSNNGYSFAVMTAFGISGADTTTVFDTRSGLPVTATTLPADPLSITTNNTNNMIIGLFRMASQTNPSEGTGYTKIVGNNFQLTEYKIVTASQSGLSVPITTGATDANGAIADAIMQSSTAASAIIGPIHPHSVYIGGASGNLFSNYYAGGGGNASAHDEGIGVAASLGADSTAELRFRMPSTVPVPSPKIMLRMLANASSGVIKLNVADATCPSGTSPSGLTLTSSAGNQTMTWNSGDADKYKDMKMSLNSSPAANDIVVVALKFITAGWTLAQPLTCIPWIIWE